MGGRTEIFVELNEVFSEQDKYCNEVRMFIINLVWGIFSEHLK